MSVDLSPKFSIGSFQVDPEGLMIVSSSGETLVEPKVMQVLVLLAEAKGETVLRETFMERVWDVDYGSDESLTRAISILRKIFKDQRGRGAMIETVPRKGYRLVGAVLPASSSRAQMTDNNGEPVQAIVAASKPPSSRKSAVVLTGVATIAAIGVVALLLSQRTDAPLQDTAPPIRNSVNIEAFNVNAKGDEAVRLANSLESQIAASLTKRGIATTLAPEAETTAEFILSGDVWDMDGEPQATLRLKDRESGLILWSEIMNRSYIAAYDYTYGVSVKTGGYWAASRVGDRQIM